MSSPLTAQQFVPSYCTEQAAFLPDIPAAPASPWQLAYAASPSGLLTAPSSQVMPLSGYDALFQDHDYTFVEDVTLDAIIKEIIVAQRYFQVLGSVAHRSVSDDEATTVASAPLTTPFCPGDISTLST